MLRLRWVARAGTAGQGDTKTGGSADAVKLLGYWVIEH